MSNIAIRGLPGKPAKSNNKEEVVKKLGARIHDWLIIPNNAFNFMCGMAIISLVLGYMYGVGIYIAMISYGFMKFFLKQMEKAPLKIPAQEQLRDEHQPHPANDKPMKGEGIFYLGQCIDPLYMNKEIWLTNDDARQHFLILGTTGAGKEQSENALIHTPDGWKRAGDIRVLDYVTTPFASEPAQVTGVYPQGVKQLWSVRFSDDRTAEVGADHLWEVHEGMESRIMTTRDIHELMKSGRRMSVIVPDAVEKPRIETGSGTPYSAGVEAAIHDRAFDPAYLEGSSLQRMSILSGIMDCEGSFDRQSGQIIFFTPSKDLAEQVRVLAWSLGGIAKLAVMTRDGLETFSVAIKMARPADVFTMPSEDMKAAERHVNTDMKIEIIDIQQTDKHENCVCIMVDHPRHLYILENYVVTHNTELLTAFAANALSWGSGLIFVDGKGDIKLMATLHALSMRWGRSADFLILNFMPQEGELAPGEITSNTLNPYTTTSASDIIQQIGGLMPSSGGDGMWKDRAMTMISAITYALVWARDNVPGADLNLKAIREYIQFKKLCTILTDPKFEHMPGHIRSNLEIYLSSLAGYNGDPTSEQGEDCLKQHGFLEMQFTGPLGSLANDYGHIFNSEYGEVDMFDVVLNRRVLVVMLPSLQKMPEDVERMGKIVVAALKTMMGATLGNVGKTVGGKVLDVMKRRVTTAPYPCLVILDEVGYYTVEGMAMMAAQVRSLGFSMIYASQDLKAMTRLNEKEAQSIIANTNTKIVMRTEDSESMELAVKAGGQGERVTSDSYELRDEPDVFGNSEWSPNKNFAVRFENRINELDLKSQRPGQFTLLHMDFIVRGKSFYVDTMSTFKDDDNIEVAPNQFIVIERPDIPAIETKRKLPEIMERWTDNAAMNEQRAKAAEEDSTVSGNSELTRFSGYMQTVRETSRDGVEKTTVNGLAMFVCMENESGVETATEIGERRRRGSSMQEMPDIMPDMDINTDDMMGQKADIDHGVEVDDDGVIDIDDTALAGVDTIMDAIRDIPSTDDDMPEKTDEEKNTAIADAIGVNSDEETIKKTDEAIEKADAAFTDAMESIPDDIDYSDIGDIDMDISHEPAIETPEVIHEPEDDIFIPEDMEPVSDESTEQNPEHDDVVHDPERVDAKHTDSDHEKEPVHANAGHEKEPVKEEQAETPNKIVIDDDDMGQLEAISEKATLEKQIEETKHIATIPDEEYDDIVDKAKKKSDGDGDGNPDTSALSEEFWEGL